MSYSLNEVNHNAVLTSTLGGMFSENPDQMLHVWLIGHPIDVWLTRWLAFDCCHANHEHNHSQARHPHNKIQTTNNLQELDSFHYLTWYKVNFD